MEIRPRMTPIFIAAVVAAGIACAAEPPLTPNQAVTRALQRNPDLAVDFPARKAVQAELAAIRAARLPRIDLEEAYTGGNNPVYVFGTLLTQRRFTAANFGLSSLNRPEPVNNLQTRISAQETVWDGGRTRWKEETASLGIELIDRSHDNRIRQLILAVLDVYYSVSLARQTWDTSQVALESAEAIVKQARARFETGLTVESDLLRSQVHFASALQREIEARGQREIASARLNRLMGEPLDAPLGETMALKSAALQLPSEESLLAEQRSRRPDYQTMLAELRQAELEVRARQADFLPTLGAFAAWETDNPSLKTYGGNNWIAGLSLRWNLFAGRGDTARLEAARHHQEQKRRQLTAMESAMTLEIRKAMVECRSAQEQVRAAQAAEAQSEESLRILKNRYDAGLASMTDLLSAETARSAASTALAEAICRHRVSFAQLEFFAGTLSPTSAAVTAP